MTRKELVSLVSMVEQYGHNHKNSIIKFGCDNTGTCFAVNRGSSHCELTMNLLKRLADAQIKHRVFVVAFHVGRSFNNLADMFTRFTSIKELNQGILVDGLWADELSLSQSQYCIDENLASNESTILLYSL